MITPERLREVLTYDEETGLFWWLFREGGAAMAWWNQHHAYQVAGSVGRRGYRNISIDNVLFKAHRLVWLYVYGVWPSDQIDHINGDKDDNRLANLRVVTNAENCRNRSISTRNATGVVGVSPYAFGRTPQWVSRIRVAGKLIHLGYFGEFDEAVAARRAAEVDHGFHPNHGKSKTPMRSRRSTPVSR